MKYVISYGARRSRLPADVTAEVVASECRSAALSFMAGASGGWEKAELARWLAGPYAHAVRHARGGERVALTPPEHPIASETIVDLIRSVREAVLAELSGIALGHASPEALADDAIALGIVRSLRDEEDGDVWVPVDAARMGLSLRVRSLFAVDALNQLEAWSTLFVCGRCHAVAFDATGRRTGLCASHRRTSGVVSRPRDDEAAASSAFERAALGKKP